MKRIIVAIVAMGTIAAHASVIGDVININLTLDIDRAGITLAETQMNGTAYTGVEMPSAYTGAAWNDLNLTSGTNALVNTDGDSGYSLVTPNNLPKWANSGYFAGGGVLAGYAYFVNGNTNHTWTVAGLEGVPAWNVYMVGEDANPNIGTYEVDGVTKSIATVITPPGAWSVGDNYEVWENVVPDANGNIDITLHSGMLGGIQLVAVPEPATLAFIGLFGCGIYLRRRLFY